MEKPNGTRTIGVALIGAGMIAKTHVSALSAAQDSLQLKAIISQRPERAEYLAQYYDGPSPVFASDLSAVTQDPTIDMVIVATPPSVRADLIGTLAAAGKHILLEKPIARTPPEALQVVEICERAGVTLGILFQHRMRASSIAAAKRIASGTLGKLGHVEIAAPLWRDQSYYNELGRGTYERDGGGVLITQAIHTLDLALSLAGPVETVHAMTATTPLHQMEAEDFAVAGLRFTSGAVGSLVATTASFPQGKEAITLHFELGSLSVTADALVISWRDGRVEKEELAQSDVGDKGPIVENHALHQAVIEDFARAIRTGTAPMVSGREGLASHRLIEAVEKSSQTGCPVGIQSQA